MGFHYIEGGWPGSNPKDWIFSLLSGDKLKNSKLVLLDQPEAGIKGKTMPTSSPF
jgi:hypothetical protein